MPSSKIEYMKTGIQGLDELLGRGLPRGWNVLVKGEPGSGKTTLGLQYLVRGAEMGEPGIYVSFNETRDEILITQKEGWNWEKWEEEGKLRFIDLSFARVIGRGQILTKSGKIDMTDFLKSLLEDHIKQIGAKRLVIDPITIISMMYGSTSDLHFMLLRFFEILNRSKVTSFLIYESSATSEGDDDLALYLAQGIILLYNQRSGDLGWSRQRGIEIYKMRGVNHKLGVYPLSISDNGISISSEFRLPSVRK